MAGGPGYVYNNCQCFLCVSKVFTLIKGNVCMLHGPMGKKLFPWVVPPWQAFGFLTRSVRQSRVMCFIALPLNKITVTKRNWMWWLCSFVCELISQNEWIFSLLWINVFNVFASGLLLDRWSKKGKDNHWDALLSETNDSASIQLWVPALPSHLGDHWVFTQSLTFNRVASFRGILN